MQTSLLTMCRANQISSYVDIKTVKYCSEIKISCTGFDIIYRRSKKCNSPSNAKGFPSAFNIRISLFDVGPTASRRAG
jgi:hypothetical protein